MAKNGHNAKAIAHAKYSVWVQKIKMQKRPKKKIRAILAAKAIAFENGQKLKMFSLEFCVKKTDPKKPNIRKEQFLAKNEPFCKGYSKKQFWSKKLEKNN